MNSPAEIVEQVRAEVNSAPEDEPSRLRLLDELHSRLEAELDRDLGAHQSPRR